MDIFRRSAGCRSPGTAQMRALSSSAALHAETVLIHSRTVPRSGSVWSAMSQCNTERDLSKRQCLGSVWSFSSSKLSTRSPSFSPLCRSGNATCACRRRTFGKGNAATLCAAETISGRRTRRQSSENSVVAIGMSKVCRQFHFQVRSRMQLRRR